VKAKKHVEMVQNKVSEEKDHLEELLAQLEAAVPFDP